MNRGISINYETTIYEILYNFEQLKQMDVFMTNFNLTLKRGHELGIYTHMYMIHLSLHLGFIGVLPYPDFTWVLGI